MSDSLRTKLHAGQTLMGTLLTVNAPEIAEAVSLAGLDWVFIDTEHSAIDVYDAQNLVRAVATPCHAAVRVTQNSPVEIKRVLDTGCDGVIVPQVNSKTEAAQVVDAAKYPPQGHRSVGVSRAQGYGTNVKPYIETANEEVAVIIQAEHIDAVKNIKSILEVEGIDAVFIGPFDLSASMGMTGDIDHAEVQQAISTVVEACRQKAVPVGILVPAIDGVQAELDRGVRLLAVGTDTLCLTQYAAEVAAAAKH